MLSRGKNWKEQISDEKNPFFWFTSSQTGKLKKLRTNDDKIFPSSSPKLFELLATAERVSKFSQPNRPEIKLLFALRAFQSLRNGDKNISLHVSCYEKFLLMQIKKKNDLMVDPLQWLQRWISSQTLLEKKILCACVCGWIIARNIKLKRWVYIIGRPIPRPIPPGIPPAWGISLADFGLLMVSSTDKIKHVASQAAVNALILMTDGSQTQALKLSAMCSLLISTPYQMFPRKDFQLILLMDQNR